ncbi:serine hydrolase [Chitinophaga sp. Cy-1792]|uniref:serine hydrolase domain-containing protein n=1 Tax=Chitinophaga sp. Cy-1792 TaxID=2608339 RepID=UPI00142370F9|nr:serine hydrolase domain-containing protein [Chitinophaga sp. Cy-1792]
MNRIYATWIGLIMAGSAVAQENQLTAKLDELSARLVTQQSVTGINVLVIKDGKTAYNKAFGYADMETKRKLQTDDIFRVASQTKAITSVAVMMLWQDGYLLLDDPISKYIPAFKNPKVLASFNPADSSYTTVPASKEISIRDLLRHTSGLSYPTFSSDPRFNAIYAKSGTATGIGSKGLLKDKIALLAKQPLVHNPGEAFTYGLSTDVLGYLVEVISGMPLDEFFRKRIFEPLDMKDTYFHLPKEKANRLVSISEKTDKGWATIKHLIYEGNPADYPLKKDTYLSGGAGLSTTTTDYAKFLTMLLNGGSYNGKQLLSSNTIALMTTNQLPQATIAHGEPDRRFGLGFELVTPENKFKYAENPGTFYWGGAFNTQYWVDPAAKMIVLIFSQEYLPADYFELQTRYSNVIYSHLTK